MAYVFSRPGEFTTLEPDVERALAQPVEIAPGVVILPPGGPSVFTPEEWADYDAGRPDRCSHDLMAREARRLARDKDGF